MVKLVGALCILFAGTAIGFLRAARYAARPRQLRELIHALRRLETEITYGYTPLPEAFKRLSSQCNEPVSLLFKESARLLAEEEGATTSRVWTQAAEFAWSSSALNTQDMEITVQIGFTLGITDRDNQLKHIALAIGQLQQQESSAREDQLKYERMSRSLGFLCAAFIVIFMY